MFGPDLGLERETVRTKDCLEMMLESPAHSGLSAILDLERILQEAIDVDVLSCAETLGDSVADDAAFETSEHRLFVIEPCSKAGVRSS